MSTIQELLERKSIGSGLEILEYCLGILRADYATPLYPQKLVLTSPTSGGHLVGIARGLRPRSLLFVMSGKHHQILDGN
jgi:hypothetical protein